MEFPALDTIAPRQIDALADLCFGPGWRDRTASRLRRGAPRIATGCFAAIDAGALIGSVQLHRLDWVADSGTRPIAILGPLVTAPDRRHEKIGSRLMALALAEADRLGLAVMLIGDQPYYGRWGFAADHTGQWQLPGPVERHRLLLRAAQPGDFAGAARLQPAGLTRAAS